MLTLRTDNGLAFTARVFKSVLASLGIAHPRGGYHDPDSHAFVESRFGKLKEGCVWRHEFQTLDQPREAIGAYVIHNHPPAPQPTQRQHAARSRGNLERRRTHPPNLSGLNRQRRRGSASSFRPSGGARIARLRPDCFAGALQRPNRQLRRLDD